MQLPRRPDIARHDACDANVVGAQVARERSRQAFDGRLASLVEYEIRETKVPADRPQIDDGSPALAAHPSDHRLRAEEHVLQVHAETIVPIFLGDIVDRMAIIIGGVVDEHVKSAAP